jgi:hypothetical protein
MRNDLQFKFKGFKPDEKVRKFVSIVAERLLFSAPSDSVMQLVVKQGKHAIQASCRIASQAGTFVADSINDNPIRAVQQIENKIREQLDIWKKSRFSQSNEFVGPLKD